MTKHTSANTTLDEARAYLARHAANDPHPKAFIRETRKHALELLLRNSTTQPAKQNPTPSHKPAITDHALAHLLTQATDTTTFNRITDPLDPGPPHQRPTTRGNA